jgi:hypothetical protein
MNILLGATLCQTTCGVSGGLYFCWTVEVLWLSGMICEQVDGMMGGPCLGMIPVSELNLYF